MSGLKLYAAWIEARSLERLALVAAFGVGVVASMVLLVVVGIALQVAGVTSRRLLLAAYSAVVTLPAAGVALHLVRYYHARLVSRRARRMQSRQHDDGTTSSSISGWWVSSDRDLIVQACIAVATGFIAAALMPA